MAAVPAKLGAMAVPLRRIARAARFPRGPSARELWVGIVLSFAVPARGAVWEARQDWSSAWQSAFAAAVEKEYGRDFCTARRLYSYCSATLYQIRAHFSWKNGLPFRVFDRNTQDYLSQDSPGPWDRVGEFGSEERLNAFLRRLAGDQIAYSHLLQHDTYAIDFLAVRPGDIYVTRLPSTVDTATGEARDFDMHTIMVKRVHPSGLLEVMYTSVGDVVQELTRGYFFEGRLPQCMETLGCGFRRFYPLAYAAKRDGSRALIPRRDGPLFEDYRSAHETRSIVERESEGMPIWVWLHHRLRRPGAPPPRVDDVIPDIIPYADAYLKTREEVTVVSRSTLERIAEMEKKLEGAVAGAFARMYGTRDALEELKRYIEEAGSTYNRDHRLAQSFEAILHFLPSAEARRAFFARPAIRSRFVILSPQVAGGALRLLPLADVIFFVLAQYGCDRGASPFFSPDAMAAYDDRWPFDAKGQAMHPRDYPECLDRLGIPRDVFAE